MLPPPPPPVGGLAERNRIGGSESSFFPRTSSRSSVTAYLLLLFTFSAGSPAFAQNSAPVVEAVYLVNAPPDGVHDLGSVVYAQVRFDRSVEVAGSPRLALTIGADIRYADFQFVLGAQGDRRWLDLRYYVAASDRDDDGISIPANALTLDGGSIKDADGNDADLTHDAVPDHPEHKVNGSLDPPPVVTQVDVFRRPLTGDTFGPDERIAARVRFSKPVVVTGNPRLLLQVGNETRGADLYAASGEFVFFQHHVDASDRDDDGISIPADAVRLNRGSIRDSRGNDADLTHEAVPDDPQFKVNGRLDAAPTIVRVWQANPPLQDETFGRGESFRVGVQFSEPVHVTGSPQLAVQVGAETRQAEFHLRGQDSSLYFEYVVQPSDVDADGYGVPGDALALNGGSIRDADGNEADLTHDAVPDDPRRKVDGGSGAPTVARVFFSRLPASQDTFVAGESVFAVARFTRDVEVSGTPQFTVQVGAQTRRADHLPRLRAAELLPPMNSLHIPGEDEYHVYFRYVVQPSDLDDDGISAPANALMLNGGSIRATDDNSDARVSHDGLTADPRRKVDGSRVDDQPPAVVILAVERPLRGVFGAGDTITVRLTMSQGMTVTGAPRFALRIGAQTRFATFREMWGTASMLFDYVVDVSDRDDNGLSIAADAIDLNGGTIRDSAGNDANLDLGYLAFNDDPDYKVDGRLTPVPALPLAGVLVLLFALLGGGWRRLARRLQPGR